MIFIAEKFAPVNAGLYNVIIINAVYLSEKKGKNGSYA